MKLRLNNNGLASADLFWSPLDSVPGFPGTQTKALSFDLGLWQLWIHVSLAVTVGRSRISNTQSLQGASLGAAYGRKVEENQGHFKAGKRDIVRSGVSLMCLGDVAEELTTPALCCPPILLLKGKASWTLCLGFSGILDETLPSVFSCIQLDNSPS